MFYLLCAAFAVIMTSALDTAVVSSEIVCGEGFKLSLSIDEAAQEAIFTTVQP